MLPALSSDRQVTVSLPDSVSLRGLPRITFAAVFARLEGETPPAPVIAQADAPGREDVEAGIATGTETAPLPPPLSDAPPAGPDSVKDTDDPPPAPRTDPPPRMAQEEPVSDKTAPDEPDPLPSLASHTLDQTPIGPDAASAIAAVPAATTGPDALPEATSPDIPRWRAFAALPAQRAPAATGASLPLNENPTLPLMDGAQGAETQAGRHRVPGSNVAHPRPSGPQIPPPQAAEIPQPALERTETLLQARIGWESTASSHPAPEARAALMPISPSNPLADTGQQHRTGPATASAAQPAEPAQPSAGSPLPQPSAVMAAPVLSSAGIQAGEPRALPEAPDALQAVTGPRAEQWHDTALARAPAASAKAAEALVPAGAEARALPEAGKSAVPGFQEMPAVESRMTMPAVKPAPAPPWIEATSIRPESPPMLAAPSQLPPAMPTPPSPHKTTPEPLGAAEITRSVSTQIAASIPDTGGFDLALDPQELGRVQLRLVHSDHGSTLFVQAERPETMDLLRRHIGQLEQDLRALGHDQLSLRFGTGGQGQQNHPNPQGPAAPTDPADAPQNPATPRHRPAMPASDPVPSVLDRLDLRL